VLAPFIVGTTRERLAAGRPGGLVDLQRESPLPSRAVVWETRGPYARTVDS
jgi:hypothetical protein